MSQGSSITIHGQDHTSRRFPYYQPYRRLLVYMLQACVRLDVCAAAAAAAGDSMPTCLVFELLNRVLNYPQAPKVAGMLKAGSRVAPAS